MFEAYPEAWKSFTEAYEADVDPDPDWIRNQWGPWIRIKEGKNGPQKKFIIIFWRAICSLLRAEGVSCGLDVLYLGLGISKLYFNYF